MSEANTPYVQNLRLDAEGSSAIRTNRGIVRYERLIVGEEGVVEKGGIDFGRFFRGLQSIRYDGFVTSHQPSVAGMGVPELARFVHDRLITHIDSDSAPV